MLMGDICLRLDQVAGLVAISTGDYADASV